MDGFFIISVSLQRTSEKMSNITKSSQTAVKAAGFLLAELLRGWRNSHHRGRESFFLKVLWVFFPRLFLDADSDRRWKRPVDLKGAFMQGETIT